VSDTRAFLRGAFLLIVVTFSLLNAESRAQRCAAARADPSLVLNYTFPATTIISEAIRKRLLERSPQQLEIEANISIWHDARMTRTLLRMANFLREKYANVHFDLVVVIGFTGIPSSRSIATWSAPVSPWYFSDVTRATYEAINCRPTHRMISEYYPEKTLALPQKGLQPGARRLW